MADDINTIDIESVRRLYAESLIANAELSAKVVDLQAENSLLLAENQLLRADKQEGDALKAVIVDLKSRLIDATKQQHATPPKKTGLPFTTIQLIPGGGGGR